MIGIIGSVLESLQSRAERTMLNFENICKEKLWGLGQFSMEMNRLAGACKTAQWKSFLRKKKKSIEMRFKGVTWRSVLIPLLKQTALNAKRYKLEGR